MNEPAVYVLRCSDGSLYTGATTDLGRRIRAHASGSGAKYTRSRRPLALLAWWHPPSYDAARSHEARFKRLDRAAKIDMLGGGEAFGCALRKAPAVAAPLPMEGTVRMAQTPPQPDEIKALDEEARHSHVRIATDKGDLVLEFYPDEAPTHVAAFLKLVKAGFYDGLKFHRVEPGFVVQGGDPDGTGSGGPGYRLKAEFNQRPHERGTLAMARTSDPDSAGSQFYICLADARFLDGQYTVFGKLTDGFDALDKIKRGDAMQTARIELA
ncbi:MAG TPA: peptidylprolyl isomerase [Candidatus Tumulicola sp.]